MGKTIATEVSVPAVQSVLTSVEVKGIRDGAYQQAKIKGISESITRSQMAFIPGLGVSDDPFTDEIKAELRDGYMLRWNEINPEVTYVAVDGQWVKESEFKGKVPAKAERFTLNVYAAFSYTQQAFGALKTEAPQKHQIIGEMRTKFNKYVSNCLNDLKRDAKRIYNEDNGIKTSRNSVSFIDWLLNGPNKDPNKSVLATIRQRAINASKIGNDDTVPSIADIDKAIAAFKGALTK
jgi:hypothetical protein